MSVSICLMPVIVRLLVSNFKSLHVFEIVGGHRLKLVQDLALDHVADNIEVRLGCTCLHGLGAKSGAPDYGCVGIEAG